MFLVEKSNLSSHFRSTKPKPSHIPKPYLLAARLFDEKILLHLKTLDLPPDSSNISLSWLSAAVSFLSTVHLEAEVQISNLKPDSDDYNDLYMDYSLKVLDLCNLISSAVNRLTERRRLMNYSLRLLKFSDQMPPVEKLNKAKDALIRSVNNTEESVRSVNNTVETVISVNNTVETVTSVYNTEESVTSVYNTEESVTSVNNTEESVRSVNNTEESVRSVNNIEESAKEKGFCAKKLIEELTVLIGNMPRGKTTGGGDLDLIRRIFYATGDLTVFVGSVLVTVLYGETTDVVKLRVPAESLWADSVNGIESRIVDLKAKGNVVLEVDDVAKQAVVVRELIEEVVNGGDDGGVRVRLQAGVEEMTVVAKRFSDGVDALTNGVNGLFRIVLKIRNGRLDV